MTQKPSRSSRSTQVAVVVGALLILFGLRKLSELLLGSFWWNSLHQMIDQVFIYTMPAALIFAGVYLVWASKTGKLKNISLKRGKALRRSVSDKRIAGVCGGLAEYVGVDSTTVRVFVFILAVASPGFILLAYILAAIFMPRA